MMAGDDAESVVLHSAPAFGRGPNQFSLVSPESPWLACTCETKAQEGKSPRS